MPARRMHTTLLRPRAEAKLLFSPDAVAGKRFTTADGRPAQAYRSAKLGRLLRASQFEDCDGKAVSRGTLFYLPSPERTVWILAAGLCP
jgi:hypothetical protein